MNGPSFENTKIETALPQIAETVSSLIVGKKSGVLLSIRKLCASQYMPVQLFHYTQVCCCQQESCVHPCTFQYSCFIILRCAPVNQKGQIDSTLRLLCCLCCTLRGYRNDENFGKTSPGQLFPIPNLSNIYNLLLTHTSLTQLQICIWCQFDCLHLIHIILSNEQ